MQTSRRSCRRSSKPSPSFAPARQRPRHSRRAQHGRLVARAWLRHYGAARVARIITIGTPHHGTALGQPGGGRECAQMSRIDGVPSGWLAQLAASETPETRALITSIYSHHDNIVAPQTSAHLPGARNLAFGGIGHVALASDARIMRQLLAEITIKYEVA